MKTLIRVALIASFATPLAWSAGTVKVYTQDNTKPKTLTNAGHLIDLVGQPRLANSWWPGAVISERQATVVAEQQHNALLARLTGLAEQEEGDDAAATVGVARARQVDGEAPILEDNLKAGLLADAHGQGPLVGGIEG